MGIWWEYNRTFYIAFIRETHISLDYPKAHIQIGER